jgi:hypothetical protein
MIVLETSSPHYKRWCNLVLLMLRRYALDDHVLSNITDLSIYWARLDNIVVTWILNTLSPELHEIVQEPMEIAHQAWFMLKDQLLGNQESCVLQLDARFCVFKQGNLDVSDYCHRMKGMAEDLHALCETITDCLLILNLLHGLNERFDYMKIFIKWSRSLPSFHTIRNDLELEEIELDTRRPRNRPPCSTPQPQKEGTLHNSSNHRVHLNRNHRVLQRPHALLTPPPTTAVKAG